VYKLLKEYRNRRILSILFAKLLLGKKVKLIVDGTILEVANLNRARTQRIKRFSGKAFWGKKKRNLYSEHYKEKVSAIARGLYMICGFILQAIMK
jgi:hypothetical protein